MILAQTLKPIKLAVSTLFAQTAKELSAITAEYKKMGLQYPLVAMIHKGGLDSVYLPNKPMEPTDDTHYDNDDTLIGIIIAQDKDSAELLYAATDGKYFMAIAIEYRDLINAVTQLHQDFPKASITIATNKHNAKQAQEAAKLAGDCGSVIIPYCKGNTFNDWAQEWCSEHNLPLNKVRNIKDGEYKHGYKQWLLLEFLRPLTLTMLENMFTYQHNEAMLATVHTYMQRFGIPSQLQSKTES